MIQLTPQVKILVCVEAADFRKGIDGLCGVCRQVLETDPLSGVVFVFRNRRSTSIKLLAYDGQGLWLCQKRLSEGRFRHWPSQRSGEVSRQLFAHELQVLLAAGNPFSTDAARQWRSLSSSSF